MIFFKHVRAHGHVLYGDRSYAPSLVRAMRNLLAAMGLEGSVKVSAHASSVLAGLHPPFAGPFNAAALLRV